MQHQNILFFSSSHLDGSSIVHRCYLVGNELKNKYNVNYEVISERGKHKENRSKFFANVPQFKSYFKTILKDADIIIIHRSCSFMTYYLLKIIKLKGVPILFDYDDAFFEKKSVSNTHLDSVIKESNAVTCGSHYLLEYSKKINENSHFLPTPVDTNLFHPKKKKEGKDGNIIIGWLGPGNEKQLPHLNIMKKPLLILSQKYDIKFKIISAFSRKVRREFSNLGFDVDFGLDHWVPLEEIPNLIADFDIGIMPLAEISFSKGKCGMKALEYMSMGIPAVVSNTGENQYIIKNGANGFLASNVDEWVKQLSLLIEDRLLRREIGKKARKTVENKYSLTVCGKKMRELIQELLDKKC